MTPDHLSSLDKEIEQKEQQVFDDEKQINLLSENVKRNKKILKLLEEGREKLKVQHNANTEQKKG